MRPLRWAWLQGALSRLFAAYIRLTLSTIRWRREDEQVAAAIWDAGGPVIVAFRHARIALSPACWPLDRAQEPRAMISRSADGAFIADAMARVGFPAIRGSTAKGGKDKGGAGAFRQTLRWLKAGNGIALTPDGPRGPAGSMTDGPPLLAKASGAPVLLVSLAARPAIRLPTWDAHVLPLPFARGAIAWDGPFTVPRDADEAALDACRRDWIARLDALDARAERMAGLDA